MKIKFNVLIWAGIVLEIILFVFFDKSMITKGPVIFWLISVIGIFQYNLAISKLSKSVKKSNPNLFKKYSYGTWLRRDALSNNAFLDALNTDERMLREDSKVMFKFVFICFLLFAISILLVFLK